MAYDGGSGCGDTFGPTVCFYLFAGHGHVGQPALHGGHRLRYYYRRGGRHGGRDIRGTRPESQRSGDAHFQPDVENGAYPADGQRESPRRVFLKLIIITALIPIFSFQKVEGKTFSPLAYTLGFALLGALLFTLTLVPVMSSMLLKRNVREKNNFFVRFINGKSVAFFDKCHAHRKISVGIAGIVAVGGLWMFTLLGTEFLPQLNEGSIYIRATLPQSISLNESVQLANKMRARLAAYPEVKQVLSQTGRPNDGTDATGFYNIEFHVDIYPEKEWESGLDKMQLIEKMQEDLSMYPGIDFNFSQPITDNVEEAASGVKGSIAVKVFGKDLYRSEKIAMEIDKILGTVEGIEDLGVIRNIGQPELRIELDEGRLARYGCPKRMCRPLSKWPSAESRLRCCTKMNASSTSWYVINRNSGRTRKKSGKYLCRQWMGR